MGWIKCFGCEKLQRDFVARTFGTSFTQLRNKPKCTQILRNAPKHWYRVQCGGLVAFIAKKSQCDFVARTFALIAPLQYVLQQVSCSYGTIQNEPKYYETHRNIGIGSNVVDWLCSLQKIPTRLRGMNFCNNCTSSTHFAPRFMQLRNDPKCIQALWNKTKHEFRVQWGGSGAFVAKNYNVTLWHELFY